MQLPAILEKRWLGILRLASRTLIMDEEGVSLGKTLLVPFREGRLVIDEARLSALLSVAYGRDIAFKTESLRHAERCYKRGELVLAQMHLALCGLQAVDLDQAQRLFVAEWALSNHVSPRQLLKLAGLGKYNPNHLGPGPGGGQFTSAGRNGTSNGLPPGAGKPSRRALAVPPWVGSDEMQVAGPARDAIAALMEQAEMQREQAEAEQKAASAAAQEAGASARSVSSKASGDAAAAGAQAAGESTAQDVPEYMKNETNKISSEKELNEEQLQNLQRFNSKLPAKAGSKTIESLSDGNVSFKADVPADNIPGSYARYEKIVDKLGNTVQYNKTTFAPDGSVIHVKVK